ncbi:hypothetical protein LCGC14_1961410 [marine sediment metagenome]|uniref:Uncharacterized protein n=1 Tax=marine sediment metagenome TaxID=412755 RepID=A0A0F9HSX5_9ZZZZ
MKTTQTDEFDEIACPYCGLIKDNVKVVGVVKCLGCRHEFQVKEKDRYSDAIGENFPVIE